MVTVIAMTYRDDQDAALARADALQVELDRSQQELAQTKSKLAQREADLVAARRPAAAWKPVMRAPASMAIAVVVASFAAFVGFIAWRNSVHAHDRAEREKAFQGARAGSELGAGVFRDCTVSSVPSGADVVSVDAAGNTYPLGRTPFTRSMGSGQITGTHLEMRHDGYRTMTINAPQLDVTSSSCALTITLDPISE